jgi:hypothetical protein
MTHLLEGLTKWLELSASTAVLGGAVYPLRAEDGATMPWLLVVPRPGDYRRPITPLREEYKLGFYLFLDSPNKIQGMAQLQVIADALQDFRGDMLPAQDVHIRCGNVFPQDGPTTNYRFVLPLQARYLHDTPA